MHKFKNYKILILTSSWGFGHLSSAIALQDHLSKNDQTEVKIVDFCHFYNKFLNQTIKQGYLSSIKIAPNLFESIFKNTNQKWSVKYFCKVVHTFISPKLNRLLIKESPDLVITNYPLWGYSVDLIRRKRNLNLPLITVITDSISIHNSWIYNDPADYYIVIDKNTKQVIHKKGIPLHKIYDYGFPLRDQFFNKIPRKIYLKDWGLIPEKFTILYLLNNNTTKRELDIIKYLAPHSDRFQAIVLLSTHKRFGKKLDFLHKYRNWIVINWLDKVASLMNSADIIISKAGGASMAECRHLKKVVLISEILPQERGNAALIINNNSGKTIKDLPPKKAASYIKQIAHFNSKKWQKMRDNAHNLRAVNRTPEACKEIMRKLKMRA